jgi:putative tricarboxylic transport membrane protein
MLKGFVMAALGLLVALVGLDPQAGVPRYTFDQLYLWDGIALVPLVVGLFGGAEVLHIMLAKSSISGTDNTVNSYAGITRGVRETFQHWRVVGKASAIGVGIGMVPGLGGSVAQFVAYGQAQQSSKHPEEFGKGAIEGVIAAGSTSNAKDSGSLIPTIAFGIPGGAATAVLLSAFLILGLDPGKEMLTTELDVTFSMVWVAIFANIVAVALAFLFIRPLTRLTVIPGPLLVPFLLFLLILGAFTASNNYADIAVMFAAAAIGVACLRWDWPRVPFLLAVVLGSLAERYLFLSYSIFGWSWLMRPGVIVLALVVVAALTQAGRIKRRAVRARTAVEPLSRERETR